MTQASRSQKPDLRRPIDLLGEGEAFSAELLLRAPFLPRTRDGRELHAKGVEVLARSPILFVADVPSFPDRGLVPDAPQPPSPDDRWQKDRTVFVVSAAALAARLAPHQVRNFACFLGAPPSQEAAEKTALTYLADSFRALTPNSGPGALFWMDALSSAAPGVELPIGGFACRGETGRNGWLGSLIREAKHHLPLVFDARSVEALPAALAPRWGHLLAFHFPRDSAPPGFGLSDASRANLLGLFRASLEGRALREAIGDPEPLSPEISWARAPRI
jgi:hypothetical protein